MFTTTVKIQKSKKNIQIQILASKSWFCIDLKTIHLYMFLSKQLLDEKGLFLI